MQFEEQNVKTRFLARLPTYMASATTQTQSSRSARYELRPPSGRPPSKVALRGSLKLQPFKLTSVNSTTGVTASKGCRPRKMALSHRITTPLVLLHNPKPSCVFQTDSQRWWRLRVRYTQVLPPVTDIYFGREYIVSVALQRPYFRFGQGQAKWRHTVFAISLPTRVTAPASLGCRAGIVHWARQCCQG